MVKTGKRPANYEKAMHYLYYRANVWPGIIWQAQLEDRIITAENEDGYIVIHSYWRNRDNTNT